MHMCAGDEHDTHLWPAHQFVRLARTKAKVCNDFTISRPLLLHAIPAPPVCLCWGCICLPPLHAAMPAGMVRDNPKYETRWSSKRGIASYGCGDRPEKRLQTLFFGAGSNGRKLLRTSRSVLLCRAYRRRTMTDQHRTMYVGWTSFTRCSPGERGWSRYRGSFFFPPIICCPSCRPVPVGTRCIIVETWPSSSSTLYFSSWNCGIQHRFDVPRCPLSVCMETRRCGFFVQQAKIW